MLRILLCRRKHVIYQMCSGSKPYFARVLNLNIEYQTDKNKLNNFHEKPISFADLPVLLRIMFSSWIDGSKWLGLLFTSADFFGSAELMKYGKCSSESSKPTTTRQR